MTDNQDAQKNVYEQVPLNHGNAVPSEEPKKEEEPTNHKKSKALKWFTFFLFLVGLAWLLLWIFYFRFHEFTDDAYANGNMININAAIPGSVVAFFADDTDLVNEGDLLVLLDPTDYKIHLDKELANLASVVLQVRQLYHNVNVARANVEVKKIVVAKAKFDFDNRLDLHDNHPLAVSNEDFVHSKDDLSAAEADLKLSEFQLKAAIDAAGNTPLPKHPLIEQQKANVRNAHYNLQHCSIYAPYTGYVAQRAVEVGQWVTPVMDLMAVIPTNYVWVDANFKETQLTHMRVGQPATVWFDMYGSDIMFKGKVLGIASGSGSVFSLIPPQNATGNWIKIVQRLPVRISLDAEQVKKYPIRLGISAEAHVNITDRTLPMLVQTPPSKPVATTSVFDIDFTKIDQMIEEVIRENLKMDNH